MSRNTQPDPIGFIQTQQAFSGFIRDPDNMPKPDDIEQRRMLIYQELFYNNIEGFVASCFPVLRTIIADTEWHEMVRDFMVQHHCQSPLFHEIAREFLTYLETERECDQDPPFMKELAHYEWVELALSFSDAESTLHHSAEQEDCLSLNLATSPVAWALAYHYPVHQISADFQPEAPLESPIYLLVYRNLQDSVTFVELNPVSARLIDLLNQNLDGYAAASKIAEEMQHPNPEVVTDGARVLIRDWISKGILI